MYVQESAEEAVGVAQKYFPQVEAKWGESGLDDIILDTSVLGVAVVLAGQTQVLSFSLHIIFFMCFLNIYQIFYGHVTIGKKQIYMNLEFDLSQLK